MCVLKSTVCDISVQVSSMLFNTLPFYTSALSPQTYHPVGRPHSQFKVLPARVALHSIKNPRVFSPRVLLDSLRMFCYTRSPIGPWLPGILFADVKPRDQACVWRHITVFNSEWVTVFILSPIVLYLVIVVNHDLFITVLYLYNTSRLVAESRSRTWCLELMRLPSKPFLSSAQIVTVIYCWSPG